MQVTFGNHLLQVLQAIQFDGLLRARNGRSTWMQPSINANQISDAAVDPTDPWCALSSWL